MLLQELGGGHVGRQHAFLDQLVGIVARGWPNFGDLALGAEDNPGFLGFEIDRTAYMASRKQHLV
ncbi:hypothetical protein D3C76_1439520 [compost metagenome]